MEYRYKRLTVIFLICCMPMANAAQIQAQRSSTGLLKVVFPPLETTASAHTVFFPKLLRLALEKTIDTYGPYELTFYPKLLTNERSLLELEKNGRVNALWSMTSPSLEKRLLPIKIPLLKELNSYKVFLIKKNMQETFTAITDKSQLQALDAGLVSSWPDTAFFRSNGFSVKTASHYEQLFHMLAADRFDYFPRGLYEVWQEQSQHAESNLVIEESFMLHYDAPIYFFVAPNNTQLAERISQGLRITLEDGSFDALFLTIPGFKRGLHELHNSTRRIIELKQEPLNK